jgi:hypothetical protein
VASRAVKLPAGFVLEPQAPSTPNLPAGFELEQPSIADKAKLRLAKIEEGGDLPPGYTQSDLQNPSFAHEAGIATNLNEGVTNAGKMASSAVKTVGGVAAGTARLALQSLDPILHPIRSLDPHDPINTDNEVARMGNASVQQARKAKDALQRGDTAGAIGHGLATLPVVGPATESVASRLFTPQSSEAIGDAIGMLAAPKVIGATVEGIRGLPETVRGAGTKLRARAPVKFAEAVGAGPEAATTVVPRMMDEGVLPNRKSVAKLDERLGENNERLAEAKIEQGGVTHPVGAVVRDVQSVAQKYRTPDGGVSTGPVADSASKLVKELSLRVAKSGTRGKISTADLLKLKEDWQEVAHSGGAYADDGIAMEPTAKARVYGDMAHALENRINANDALGVPNAEAHYLIQAKGLTESPKPLPGGVFTKIARKITPSAVKAVVPSLFTDLTTSPSLNARGAMAMDYLGSLMGGKAPVGPYEALPPRFPQEALDAVPRSEAMPLQRTASAEPRAYAAAEQGPAIPLAADETQGSLRAHLDNADRQAYLKSLIHSDNGVPSTPSGPLAAGDMTGPLANGNISRVPNAEPRSVTGSAESPGPVPPPGFEDAVALYQAGRITFEDLSKWLNTTLTQTNAAMSGYTKTDMGRPPATPQTFDRGRENSEWPKNPNDLDENDSLFVTRKDPKTGAPLKYPIPNFHFTKKLPDRFKNARSVSWGAPAKGLIDKDPDTRGQYGVRFDPRKPKEATANTILVSRTGTDTPGTWAHEVGHAIYTKDLEASERTEFDGMVDSTLRRFLTETQAVPAGPKRGEHLMTIAAKYPKAIIGKFVQYKNEPARIHNEAFAELNSQYLANPSAFKAAYPAYYNEFKKLYGGKEYIRPH